MDNILFPGFTNLGQLKIGNLSNVYRCVRDSDKRKVIVKIVDNLVDANDAIQDIEHEFYLLKKISELNANYTIHPLELIYNQFKTILVMDNIDGILANNYLNKKQINIKDFFTIAIQMTTTLELLHKLQIIHKDINPSNFLIIPATKQTFLVNLINAEIFDSTEISNAYVMKESLDYISPEQTARINRPLDYRTDFYSLGITFYEMLVGSTPFHSDDPIKTIHDHIATTPRSLEQINPEIPLMLDKLIQKLLKKSPEDRYIHASSLLEDLTICQQQWLKNKTIKEFQLGKNDTKNVLQLSSKIYGIDSPIKELVEHFHQVEHGEKLFCLISGPGGAGKTTCVNELKRYILEFRGYFVKGNYDQLQFKTPYAGIVLAFNELIQIALTEPEEKLLQVREDILRALGNNAGIMIEFLPDLAHIIGKQNAVLEVNFTEAQNRLMISFKNLLSVFLKPGSPLILFLDNLQWADSASWKLLEELLEDKYLKGLMVVGSYRDNEVDANHPLIILKNKLLHTNIMHEISLSPWGIDALSAFLEDTFLMPQKDIMPLAHILLVKTKGNPFYVKNFLSSIYRGNLICFNDVTNQWLWDIDKIQQERLSDNVIDFLLDEIHNLSPSSQDILKYASCFGHSFNLSDLFEVCQNNQQQLLLSVQEIVKFNFIIPKADARKAFTLAFDLSSLKEEVDLRQLVFEFSHDRVQQAALSSLPKEVKQEIHLSIGRILIKEHQPQKDDPVLFSVMDHINQSLPLIKEDSEKELLAKYNLWAGLKAIAAVAQMAANNYFQSGLILTKDWGWERHYNLVFNLHKGYIETLYHLNEFESANQLYADIKSKIRTPLEDVEISLIKIYAYVRINRHQEGLEECFRALALLDFHVSKKISSIRFLMEMVLLWYRLGSVFNNRLENMTVMTDAKDIVISKILDHLITIAYLRGNSELLASVACKSIRFSLRKGYSKYTPYALLTLACMYVTVTGLLDMKKAHKLMNLADNIQEKAYDPILAASNNVLKGNFLLSWFKHAREAVKCEQSAYLDCMELGEIEQAIYTTHAYAISFVISNKLSDMCISIESGIVLTYRYNNYGWHYYLKFFKLMMAYLMGNADEDFEKDLTYYLSGMLEVGNLTTYASACSYAIMIFYIMGDTEKASYYSELFARNKVGVWGVMPDSLIGLLFSMILEIKKATPMQPAQNTNVIQASEKLLKKIILWSDSCPENFSFARLWLDAELNALQGNNETAMLLFDEAINEALKYGYENFVAIIAESASEFYSRLKRLIIAKSYYQLAYSYYQRWGATLKCKQLMFKYPNMDINYGDKDQITGTVTSKSLDLESVMRANIIISGEVELEKLLEKILAIALENAGAQIAAFIFKEKEQFELVAYMQDTVDTKIKLQDSAIIINSYIPVSVINYVDRTLKELILDNEVDISKFNQDEYIQKNNPKSILCLPIMNQGRRIGYLYLENRISEKIFTKDRLYLLKLLSGEIAVSIENAKLYNSIGRFVPYEFLHHLKKESIVEAQLGDNAKKEMSILFCDINKFTNISENLEPELIFRIINLFLWHMEPIINEHDGFIDKYIGDAIMALFNTADDAVRAGLAILEGLTPLNKELVAQGFPAINVGVGINTGMIMAGIVGGKKRWEVTVLGDSVNLASRLENLTRSYEANLLISDRTKLLSSSDLFEFQEITNVRLKGIENPITVWSVNQKTW